MLYCTNHDDLLFTHHPIEYPCEGNKVRFCRITCLGGRLH